MLNILIADADMNYIRNLMSYINSAYDSIRVFNISTNSSDTLEILQNSNNIDIVLVDSQILFSDDFNLIEHLTLKQLDKYANSFIVLSNSIIHIEHYNVTHSKVVYTVLQKDTNFIFITNYIDKLISEKLLYTKSQEIKLKISNQLTSLGYSLSHIGTHYLIDIIEMIYLENGDLIKNLKNNVYPIISKRYKQSCNNIKTNIIRATDAMYYNCPEEILMSFFSLNVVVKPSIKTVINTILLKLSKE